MTKVYQILLFIFVFSISFVFFEKTPEVERSIASKRKSLADIGHTRSYLILDNKLKVSGLVNNPKSDGEYTRRLLGKLLQSAHKTSKDDWSIEDSSVMSFNTYNTFLLLSLQVPFQESQLMHFVQRSPEYCYFANDILDPINPRDFFTNFYPKRINELTATIKLFKEKVDVNNTNQKELLRKLKLELRNENIRYVAAKDLYDKPYLDKDNKKVEGGARIFNRFTGLNNSYQHCSKLKKNKDVEPIGLKFSNDYKDVGLLQFNVESHGDFFKNHEIFDFNKMIDYGVGYLYEEGFNFLATMNTLTKEQRIEIQNKKKIPDLFKKIDCFDNLNLEHFQDRILLLQGSWAGRYNSGHVKRSCRMKQNQNSRKLNDDNYKLNLSRMFFKFKEHQQWKDNFLPFKKSSDEVTNLYEKFLPVESLERKAFDELLSNVFNGESNYRYISEVLKTNYDISDIGEEKVIVPEPEHSESNVEDSLVILIDEQSIEPLVETVEIVSIPAKELLSSPGDINLNIDLEEKIINKQEEVLSKEELKDVIPPQTSIVEIPAVNENKFTHMISGTDVNIRSNATYGKEALCWNTYIIKNRPLKLGFIEKIGDFIKVEIKNLEELNMALPCDNLKGYFIHADYVKPVLKFDIIKRLRYLSTGPLRKEMGKSKPTKGMIGPSIINIIEEHAIYNRYLWYKILQSDGQSFWLYAGDLSSGKMRVEEINE